MPKTVETEQERMYRETVAKIATNIANLARAVESLVNGPLKRNALVLLLASSSGQSQKVVSYVLRALQNLESEWLNK
jgi:hypothetical protein